MIYGLRFPHTVCARGRTATLTGRPLVADDAGLRERDRGQAAGLPAARGAVAAAARGPLRAAVQRLQRHQGRGLQEDTHAHRTY